MTNATREALEKIKQTLHEAGWDAPTPTRDQLVTPARLARIRHAYETLLRKDHSGILEATLVDGLDIDQAGARMGLSAEEAGSLLAEALLRLGDFVETCDVPEACSSCGLTYGLEDRCTDAFMTASDFLLLAVASAGFTQKPL